MTTLYDVYPYTTGEILEFSIMTELPSSRDVQHFGDAAIAAVREHGSDDFINQDGDTRFKRANFWLPEGIVMVSEIYDLTESPNHELPESLRVTLTVAHSLGDPSTSREIEILQDYSNEQQDAFKLLHAIGITKPVHKLEGFTRRPRVIDFGLETEIEADIYENIAALVELRSDQVAETLNIQAGTLTQDLGLAQIKATLEELLPEIRHESWAEDQMKELFTKINQARKSKETFVSKMTLQKLTDLLVELT